VARNMSNRILEGCRPTLDSFELEERIVREKEPTLRDGNARGREIRERKMRGNLAGLSIKEKRGKGSIHDYLY